jgi:hypothetical protein
VAPAAAILRCARQGYKSQSLPYILDISWRHRQQKAALSAAANADTATPTRGCKYPERCTLGSRSGYNPVSQTPQPLQALLANATLNYPSNNPQVPPATLPLLPLVKDALSPAVAAAPPHSPQVLAKAAPSAAIIPGPAVASGVRLAIGMNTIPRKVCNRALSHDD